MKTLKSGELLHWNSLSESAVVKVTLVLGEPVADEINCEVFETAIFGLAGTQQFNLQDI